MRKIKINLFSSVVLTLVIVYGAVKWGIPALSRQITNLPFPLPVPGALMFIFMVLTLVALFLYVTYSDESLDEFLRPVKKFLRGEYGKAPRAIVMVTIPFIVGWQVYETTVPREELPVSLRMQHPASNFPRAFENLKNPFAYPSDADIEDFIEQAEANDVGLVPQVMPDVERWMYETDPDHMLSFITTEPVRKFLSELESGNVGKETAKAALLEKNLFEGRALYAINCLSCHGASVSGDGQLADGFKLRPLNFTDSGTIEIIVEGYAFWRVANGGPGLPAEATPWDSAMPEWKLTLSEEEQWRIILAIYDMAGKAPRIPESD